LVRTKKLTSKSKPTTARVTSIMLGEEERRELLRRAAARSVALGRPVSLSDVTRQVIKLGLESAKAA